MRISVCVSSVFPGVPAAEAIRRAAGAGYEICEMWIVKPEEAEGIFRAIRETGVEVCAILAPMVPLNDPSRRKEYLAELQRTAEIAVRLGAGTLLQQAGQEIKGVSRDLQRASIVDGLRAASEVLASYPGVVVGLEPLNPYVEHVGTYLTRSDEALEIVRQVGQDNVKLVFDIYHQQITEGNLIHNLLTCLPEIRHIHMAGAPGRHEIYERSEINYPPILRAVTEAGYTGAFGLEYVPTLEPEESLKRTREYLDREE